MNNRARISLWIVVVLLIGFGVFLYSSRALATNTLTSLNANDAMAYRYTAMAKYYEEQSSIAGSPVVISKAAGSTLSAQTEPFSGYPLLGVDLTTLSPTDAMAYRYQALAYYYSTHLNATR